MPAVDTIVWFASVAFLAFMFYHLMHWAIWPRHYQGLWRRSAEHQGTVYHDMSDWLVRAFALAVILVTATALFLNWLIWHHR